MPTHKLIYTFVFYLTVTGSELGAQVILCGELCLLLGVQGSRAS